MENEKISTDEKLTHVIIVTDFDSDKEIHLEYEIESHYKLGGKIYFKVNGKSKIEYLIVEK